MNIITIVLEVLGQFTSIFQVFSVFVDILRLIGINI